MYESIKISDIGISVTGTGMFGFVLARHFALKYPEKEILIYDKNDKVRESLIKEKKHPIHFRGYTLPDNVRVEDLKKVVEKADILVMVVPTQKVREAVKEIKPYLKKDTIVLNVAKGLEIGTGKRISEIIKEEIGEDCKYATLSGGTIAKEVIEENPICTEIASNNKEIISYLQKIISTNKFRVYGNIDLIGVEYAGALKNIISMGAGITEGLGFGYSSVAALVSRGIKEIENLVEKFGADKKTFGPGGQAGLGDFMTSCFGDTRNREFGKLVAKMGVENALKVMKEQSKLVEGYYTVEAAKVLADKVKIEMPVTEQIYQILYKEKDPKKAVIELMTRDLKFI